MSSQQAAPSTGTRTPRQEPLATRVSGYSNPLGSLVSRGSEGLDKLYLLAVNEDGLVSVLHSFFQFGESAYEDRPGKLFAIRSEIPANGLPAIVRLKAIHFAANFSFLGTPRLEFKGNISGLISSISKELQGQREPAYGRG